MTRQYGLKDDVIRKIHGVLERYPQVQEAIIYGSRAKGNYRNGSDIDLTLVGGEDLDRSILNHIIVELDELFLPYTIDVSIFSSISDSDVMEHIRRVGKVFYRKVS